MCENAKIQAYRGARLISVYCFLSLSKASNTFSANTRPLHSTCGKGGAIAQLQAIAELICTDVARKKATTNVLKDIPLNAMAPAEKGVCIFFLASIIIPNVIIPELQ